MSEYWHTRKEIPVYIINYIKEIVNDAEISPVRCNSTVMYQIDGYSFKKIFELNREVLYRGDCTAPADENNYNENKNYITLDGLSGFSITPSGWIVSVYSNRRGRKFLNILKYFINNNHKIMCVTAEDLNKSKLINLYQNKLGFKIVAHTHDDTYVMQETYGKEFIEKFTDFYGSKPKHVFMMKLDNSINDVCAFDDLDKAINYVNNYNKRE